MIFAAFLASADIHDGPEHNTLQSETGCIDVRPLTASSFASSCNARRADFGLGTCAHP